MKNSSIFISLSPPTKKTGLVPVFFVGNESGFEPVLWQSYKKSSQVQRKPSSACKRKARCDSFPQGMYL